MADSRTAPGTDDLQFDRAIDAAAASADGPVCTKCSSAIRMYYYHVNGETVCSTCKQGVDRANGGSSKASPGMLKPFMYGLGAAVVGAFVYWAVMEYMNLEIGIVAILIGYMVGNAVKNALGSRGGRRYQVMSAALVYFAVALAYSPFALGGGDDDETSVSADSTGVLPVEAGDAADGDVVASIDPDADAAGADTEDAAATPEVEKLAAGGFMMGVGAMLFLILALPVIVILGSMPGGLISAVIIGFGMHQAWGMTAGEEMSISGPFKVGTPPPATA